LNFSIVKTEKQEFYDLNFFHLPQLNSAESIQLAVMIEVLQV